MSKAEEYNSKLLDDLLNDIDPKEAARIEKRMLLAQKIDDARIASNLSKGDFAKKMGVKPSVITKWLSGTHNFTADTLSDIEEILGINLLSVTCKTVEPRNFIYIITTNLAHKQKFIIDRSNAISTANISSTFNSAGYLKS